MLLPGLLDKELKYSIFLSGENKECLLCENSSFYSITHSLTPFLHFLTESVVTLLSRHTLVRFGIVGGDVVEEHHQEEHGYAQHVGEDCELHVSNHL